MTTLLSAGIPVVFILIAGLCANAFALAFFRHGEPNLGDAARSMNKATAVATLAGVCASLGAVATKVPQNEEWANSPDVGLIVLSGIGEALVNGVMGFSLVAFAWFLIALAERRNA